MQKKLSIVGQSINGRSDHLDVQDPHVLSPGLKQATLPFKPSPSNAQQPDRSEVTDDTGEVRL